MEIKELNEKEITAIYKKHLKKDFPRSERRGLKNILKIRADGHYEAYGLFDGGSLCGYAFLVKNGEDHLLDYFAAVSGKRGMGIGSEFLRLLKDALGGMNSLLAEAESPDEGEENTEKTRRISFYLKNGFYDSSVCARTFGVDYRLLVYSPSGALSEKEAKDVYLKHYNIMLPAAVMKRAVKIKE